LCVKSIFQTRRDRDGPAQAAELAVETGGLLQRQLTAGAVLDMLLRLHHVLTGRFGGGGQEGFQQLSCSQAIHSVLAFHR
jgi:hypothetical protein